MQSQIINKKTWLLTWNPLRHSGKDPQYGIEELKRDLDQVGYAISKWSCGVTKTIHAGDRVFLMRLGQEPHGIIASGVALSDVFTGTHWDEERRNLGVKAKRIYVKYIDIRMSDNEMLPIGLLKERFPSVHWSSQSSGIKIPDSVLVGLSQLRKL